MEDSLRRSQADYLSHVLEHSSSPHNVILVEGARQVGKTTFVKQVLKDFSQVVEVNLEENRTLSKDIDLCSDFDEFTLRLSQEGLNTKEEQILFIDEAQESEQLGRFVRFMKEKWINTRSILSGSSMTRLFRSDHRVPVGRIQRFLLQPFSLYEFISYSEYKGYLQVIEEFDPTKSIGELAHNKLLEVSDLYLRTGGLPEVVKSFLGGLDYKQRCREILIDQEDDFINKSGLTDRYRFMEALQGVANYISGPSKYTHIGDTTKAAKQILSILQNWKLVYEIEQKSLSSTSTLTPKRYLYDLGILKLARAQPFPDLALLSSLNAVLRTQLGGLFENLVLISLKEHHLGNVDLVGWKDGPGDTPEVDFVLLGRKRIPIECKASLKISSRNFSSVRRYLEKTDLRFGVIVSAAPYQVFKERGLILVNLPIYLCTVDNINKLSQMNFKQF